MTPDVRARRHRSARRLLAPAEPEPDELHDDVRARRRRSARQLLAPAEPAPEPAPDPGRTHKAVGKHKDGTGGAAAKPAAHTPTCSARQGWMARARILQRACRIRVAIAHPSRTHGGQTAHRWVRDRHTDAASAEVCGAGAFAGGQAHRNVTGFERSAVIVPPPRTFDCGSTESNGGSI